MYLSMATHRHRIGPPILFSAEAPTSDATRDFIRNVVFQGNKSCLYGCDDCASQRRRHVPPCCQGEGSITGGIRANLTFGGGSEVDGLLLRTPAFPHASRVDDHHPIDANDTRLPGAG